MATRWGIASAGKISHDFVNALATYGDNSGHKVDFMSLCFGREVFGQIIFVLVYFSFVFIKFAKNKHFKSQH
jgi:ABC-type multidrug transport system permease subunit